MFILKKIGLASAFVCTLLSTHVAKASESRALWLPPSANLHYKVKSKIYGIPISGESVLEWEHAQGIYALHFHVKANFMGDVLDVRSTGKTSPTGLLPEKTTEKTMGKSATTLKFDHAYKTITLSNKRTYAMAGDSQDATSVLMQLTAKARQAPQWVRTGKSVNFQVARRNRVEKWTFKLVGEQTLNVAGKDVFTYHLARLPQGKKQRHIHVWLAPSMQWYPVRIKTQDKKRTIDQRLTKITRNAL